jgi:hypothetical protein
LIGGFSYCGDGSVGVRTHDSLRGSGPILK